MLSIERSLYVLGTGKYISCVWRRVVSDCNMNALVLKFEECRRGIRWCCW